MRFGFRQNSRVKFVFQFRFRFRCVVCMADLRCNFKLCLYGRTERFCSFAQRISALFLLDLPFEAREESQKQQEKELKCGATKQTTLKILI